MLWDSNEDLQELWLTGLGLIKPFITPQEMQDLYTSTEVGYTSSRISDSITFLRKGTRDRVLLISPRVVQKWHRVEQLELILFGAVIGHLDTRLGQLYSEDKPLMQQQNLCSRAGCVCTDARSPSERWRIGGFQGHNPARLYALAPFPRACTICEMPVNSDEPEPSVHRNCRLYALTVMLPAMKRQYQEANAV